MSTHIEWLSARYTVVNGFAEPGEFENDGSENDVACITVRSVDGDGLAVVGRPEELLAVARVMVKEAERLVMETMRDPALRSLYGIVEPQSGAAS